MLPNKDQIARPAKGRHFPLSVPGLLTQLRDRGYAHSDYYARLSIFLRNPTSSSDFGIEVAAFYPQEVFILYSLSDDIAESRGRIIADAALRELRIIDSQTSYHWNRREVVSYRAYLGELNSLVLTRRTRLATLAKYRGGAKFSNAFKPKGVSTKEEVLQTITIG